MNKFFELISVMKLYEANFRNLHWNSAGEEFNDAHKDITTNYYELFADNIDKVAEMMAMLDMNAPNYMDTVKIIDECEKEYMVVDTSQFYNRKAIVDAANVMLNDVCILLADVLQEECFEDHINDGIKSEFETILYDFSLQARYINKRKLLS